MIFIRTLVLLCLLLVLILPNDAKSKIDTDDKGKLALSAPEYSGFKTHTNYMRQNSYNYEYIKDEDPPMPKHYVKGVREFIQFYVKAKEQQGSKRKSLPVPGKIVNLKSTHVLDEFDGTSQQTISIRVHTYTSNFTGGSRVIFLMTASIIL